ncbi:hypothetical protein [Carboxylicivirga sp. RSCT41]|uniref:hypothetical protein n=1 Tax=Carboxylicivirga agarovorans TaxID=3417570 RepID=UPI003D34E4EA
MINTRLYIGLVFMILISNSSYGQEEIYKEKIDSIQNLIDSHKSSIDLLVAKKDEVAANLNAYMIEKAKGDVLICTIGTRVYRESNCIGDYYCSINNGDRAIVIEIVNERIVHVKFRDHQGYVLRAGFITIDEYIEKEVNKAKIQELKREQEKQALEARKKREEEKAIAEAKRREKQRQALEQRKKDIVAKYGLINGEKVLDGYVWIGMTKEMLIDSKGNPDDINRSVGSWGVHEQWVYHSIYVYLEDGVVTSYQD